MPLRPLTEVERQRIKRLTAESVDVTIIQPTKTGLGKSILDATAPVRNFLKSKGLHDYETQGLGATECGIHIESAFLNPDAVVSSRASLYRPKTKKGDPRIWFSKLPSYVEPDDMLAIATHDGQLWLLNITKIDIVNILDVRQSGPIWEIIQEIGNAATSVAHELLAKLRFIAQGGFVPSVMDQRADTAIGRTLESALGIAINSRQEPDYKGIELKSYRRKARASQQNRKQLFAKVPNWDISKFKSMDQILTAFGYDRDGGFKLNCTVSASSSNSQGLRFKIDDKSGILNDVSDQKEYGAFASWYLSDLRDILVTKHDETFWVGAKAHQIDGREHFEFTDVIHTRKPIASQFDILLEQGDITMDHMVKRNSRGKAEERGPSFKLNPSSLDLLFPPPRSYELRNLNKAKL